MRDGKRFFGSMTTLFLSHSRHRLTNIVLITTLSYLHLTLFVLCSILENPNFFNPNLGSFPLNGATEKNNSDLRFFFLKSCIFFKFSTTIDDIVNEIFLG